MSFLNKVLRREAYSVSVDKATTTFLYREGELRMNVSGEVMADGYAVYTSSIQKWENSPSPAIDDVERQRIATNIRRYFIDRGDKIYLS